MNPKRCAPIGWTMGLGLTLLCTSALAKYPGPCVELFKDPAQGGISYFYAYSYGAQDRLESKIKYASGSNVPLTITQYTYDVGGQLVTEALYDDRNPRPSSLSHFAYNPDGSVRATLIDHDGNGTIDETVVHNHAPDHSSRTDLIDRGSDGSLDGRALHSFSYDSRGNVIADRTQDFDSSGNVISTTLTTFDHDWDNNQTARYIDRGADGSIDVAVFVQYACW